LESLSFSRDGNEFASAHIDGSYIIWNSAEVSRPKEPANTPYGKLFRKIEKNIYRIPVYDVGTRQKYVQTSVNFTLEP
jgi:hypothetical protein